MNWTPITADGTHDDKISNVSDLDLYQRKNVNFLTEYFKMLKKPKITKSALRL